MCRVSMYYMLLLPLLLMLGIRVKARDDLLLFADDCCCAAAIDVWLLLIYLFML